MPEQTFEKLQNKQTKKTKTRETKFFFIHSFFKDVSYITLSITDNRNQAKAK